MDDAMTTASLTIKPWTRDNTDKAELKDLLARVNLERGHFRDITEATLQEEIAAEGGLESSSSDDEDDELEGEGSKSIAKKAPTTREGLYAAKAQLVHHIGDAQQDILMALDFISLLESKYAPNQAKVTLSSALKDQFKLPMGSLGADIWDEKAMPTSAAREAQDNLLARKVRLCGLRQSADDLSTAARRLQDNVQKEVVFWDQLQAISEKGWSVSKIPAVKHLLGVHFGFRGSSLEFAQKNVAALLRDDDGNIVLERGIGTKPKAIRVVLRREGNVVGSSRLPSLLDHAETTLDARIRHARDSVYDEELFHEMIRESRTLVSMGVSMKGSIIRFSTGANDELEVEFELLSLDEDHSLGPSVSHELDVTAQAVVLVTRLLLRQEHCRKMNERREIPAPLSVEQKEDTKRGLAILQPLLTGKI